MGKLFSKKKTEKKVCFPVKKLSNKNNSRRLKSGNIRKYINLVNGIPLGLKNTNGYCFLNSVVQLLFSCEDFTSAVIQYHINDEIALLPFSDEQIFVNYFCKLIYELKKMKKVNLLVTTNQVQSYFRQSSDGDDVYKHFMKILTLINDVIKKPSTHISQVLGNAGECFAQFRSSSSFIFDLFYGQMANLIFCKNCDNIFSMKHQLIKGLPLLLQNVDSMTLQSCIDNFLNESWVDVDGQLNYNCCHEPHVILKTEITNAPRYLCLYLNRGSFYKNGLKNDCFVSNNGYIKLKTTHSEVAYQLLSVIDHYGTCDGGHYITNSTFDNQIWWCLNDQKVTKLKNSKENIVSRNSVMFMFKLCPY